MARSKIVFRKGAFAEIRTLPKVLSEVDSAAERVASAAGEGFVAEHAQETGGRVRGRAAVHTTDFDSMRRNAKDNTLVKALGMAAS